MRVGELLSPIVAAIGRGLVSGTYIQADETPVGVQMHDSRGKNHQAYVWQYGRAGGHVVFRFSARAWTRRPPAISGTVRRHPAK